MEVQSGTEIADACTNTYLFFTTSTNIGMASIYMKHLFEMDLETGMSNQTQYYGNSFIIILLQRRWA